MSDERITPEMIEAADHASLDPKGCYVPGVGNCGGTHNRCYWRDVLAAVYPLIEQDVTRRLAEQAGTNPWEESSDGRYCKWCGCAAPGHHYYVHGTQHAASCPVARFRHAARARAVLAP